MIPPVSPERDESPLPTKLREDWFTAVLLPMGAVAGVIVLFGLATTDRLIIPGLTDRQLTSDVSLFGIVIGSIDYMPGVMWAAGFLIVFVLVGGVLGFALGGLCRRLCYWGK